MTKVVENIPMEIDNFTVSAGDVISIGIRMDKNAYDELSDTYTELVPYVVLEASMNLSDCLDTDSGDELDEQFEKSIDNLIEIFETNESIDEKIVADVEREIVEGMFNTALDSIRELNNSFDLKTSLKTLEGKLNPSGGDVVVSDFLTDVAYTAMGKNGKDLVHVVLVFRIPEGK